MRRGQPRASPARLPAQMHSVDLAAELGERVYTFQSPTRQLRGLLRNAMRVAFEAILNAPGTDTELDGWKLFALAPLGGGLLKRPERCRIALLVILLVVTRHGNTRAWPLDGEDMPSVRPVSSVSCGAEDDKDLATELPKVRKSALRHSELRTPNPNIVGVMPTGAGPKECALPVDSLYRYTVSPEYRARIRGATPPGRMSREAAKHSPSKLSLQGHAQGLVQVLRGSARRFTGPGGVFMVSGPQPPPQLSRAGRIADPDPGTWRLFWWLRLRSS